MTEPTTSANAEFPSGPPKGDREVTFLESPLVDQMLRSMVTLTMELSVTRERLRAVEQVLDAKGISMAEEIETLTLEPEEDAARRSEREKLIQSVLGPIIARLAQA